MPSLPCTNSSTTADALERRATADSIFEAQPPRTLVEASTVIAVVFGFAAIMIIATSACIIFNYRRRQQPSETIPRWGRTLADADRQSDSIDWRPKVMQQNLGTKQVPMLQPMAFLQGREGPKELTGGGGKRRRSSTLPRLIADGMGGIWPRRHSIWTLNSNYAVGEDEEEQGGTSSRRVSKKSHRSKRGSKATISRKNGSHLSTNSAMLTTAVRMERMVAKKPSTIFTEASPSLSASPSAFPAPQLSRDTSASTGGMPSSYQKGKLRPHRQGDSFLEDDIREDELQTNYVGPIGSAASSSILNTIDLAAFPVPPLPALNVRNHVSNVPSRF